PLESHGGECLMTSPRLPSNDNWRGASERKRILALLAGSNRRKAIFGDRTREGDLQSETVAGSNLAITKARGRCESSSSGEPTSFSPSRLERRAVVNSSLS